MVIFNPGRAITLSLKHDFKLEIGRRDGHLYRNRRMQDLFPPAALTISFFDLERRLRHITEVSFYPTYLVNLWKVQLSVY